jgi:ribosome-associated toxin RatA of RatAB toxin-antitoxin module
MVSISRSALLPYPAELIYALVNDIESYPEFMLGCHKAVVLERSATEIVARLELGKAGLRYAFTTRNLLYPPYRMDMTLVEGPFRKLDAQWHFVALSDHACKASLDLQFEFSTGLIDVALRTLFEATGRDLVNAVSKRAEQLYGKK